VVGGEDSKKKGGGRKETPANDHQRRGTIKFAPRGIYKVSGRLYPRKRETKVPYVYSTAAGFFCDPKRGMAAF